MYLFIYSVTGHAVLPGEADVSRLHVQCNEM